MLGRHWFALFFCLPALAVAEPIGRLTFSEGQLRLLRGVGVHATMDGMALEPSDIFETSEPGFALLEFSDGTLVALGGKSRLMLGEASARSSSKPPSLMLLEGWAKVQTATPANDAGNRSVASLATPKLLLSWKATSLTTHAQANTSAVFVENGEAAVATIGKNGKAGAPLAVKSSQFLSIGPDKPAAVLPRSSEGFLAAVPEAFRDALPSRIGKFADMKTPPRVLNEVRYEEVAHWLKAPTMWRNGFVKRFGPRTKDEAFRRGLDSELKDHPEWDRVLHPEKYEPKQQKPSAYSTQPAR